METTHNKNSARDFFLYVLAVGTLYFCVWRFIDMLFEYINHAFPDRLDGPFNYAFENIRVSMATLIIVFPVYLGVTWFLRKDIIKNPEKSELKVRKWLLYFTLFLAAVTIIVDMVTLVIGFLNGDLTVRFLFKVLVVLLTASGVFGYYIWDLKREITSHSRPSRVLLICVSAVVIASVVGGFFVIGSPAKQRLMRMDEKRMQDLSGLQNEVVNYWLAKSALPRSIEELKAGRDGMVLARDPETDKDYEYKKVGDLAYEICADFKLSSLEAAGGSKYSQPMYPGDMNWDFAHDAGKKCFKRDINPATYKPMMLK